MLRASFPRSFVLILQIVLHSAAAGAAGADLSGAEKDVEFFVSACQNSIDDPAAVGRLAKEQNWSSQVDPDRVDFKPLKIRGMWRVNRDGRTYTVTLGVDPKGIVSCFVSFAVPGPTRDDFSAIAAKSLPLKTEDDGEKHGTGVQFQTYRIKNSPAGSMLQIVSMDDLVIGAMIFGPFPEAPSPPPK
jgi:hypothetical protein